MVPVHELAALQTDRPREDVELVQAAKEPLGVIRCPSCKGLRSIAYRNRETSALCPECRRGDVVVRTQFHNYWLERFTLQEIREMARAIWS